MEKTLLTQLFGRIPATGLLVFSLSIRAMSASIVVLLITIAGTLGEHVASAISFCNVLFVGNLCASLVVLSFFGPKKILRELYVLDGPSKWKILVFGSLSALLSSLVFTALSTTTVTDTVLLARLGPVLYLIGASVLYRQTIGKSEWFGFSLILIGILGTIFFGNDFGISKGEILILSSALIYATVTLLGKDLLKVVTSPALIFSRSLFSSIVFFVIAYWFFGPTHFMDAYYGPLWGIMLIYALIVVVAGQLSWYRALGKLSPVTVARWTVLTPAMAVGYAIFINGEHPSLLQLAALAFVTMGTFIPNLAKLTPPGLPDNMENSVGGS
jgi:drug/metabolite transporter (DMT)-like permease